MRPTLILVHLLWRAGLAKSLVLLLRGGWSLVLPRAVSEASAAFAASKFASPDDRAVLLQLAAFDKERQAAAAACLPAAKMFALTCSSLLVGELALGQDEESGEWFPGKVMERKGANRLRLMTEDGRHVPVKAAIKIRDQLQGVLLPGLVVPRRAVFHCRAAGTRGIGWGCALSRAPSSAAGRFAAWRRVVR